MEQLSGLVDSASKFVSDTADDITDTVSRAVDSVSSGGILPPDPPTTDSPDSLDSPTPSGIGTQSPDSLPSYEVAVNSFYELKSAYENRFFDFKRNMKKKQVFGGKGEVARRIGKYKPKCPKCNGIGGASFTMDASSLEARCTASTPCGFRIHISRAAVVSGEALIDDLTEEERYYKDAIIREKNKIVFDGYEPTEYDIERNAKTMGDISFDIEIRKNILVHKSNAIHGTPADRKEYEMLEDNYKQILGEIQKLKDGVAGTAGTAGATTIDRGDRTYADIAEIYKTRLVPTIESMRPLRKAFMEHNIGGMELANDTYDVVDYSDRVVTYIMK